MSVFKGWRLLWPKKQEQPLGFTEMATENYTSPAPVIQSKPTLLRTCEQCSIATFKRCYYYNDFSGLGEGTFEEITEAWTDIVSEWVTLMKNGDSENYLAVGTEVLNLKRHTFYVEQAVFFLKRRYDQEILDKLIALGYPGEYPENDTEALHKQLDHVLSLYKTQVFRLSELNEEFERLNKAKDGGKPSVDNFESDIQRLNRYQGYRMDQNSVSILEYAMVHNNYFDELKRNQNQPPD